MTAAMLVGDAQDRPGVAAPTSWQFEAVDAVVKPATSVTLNSGLSLELPGMPALTDQRLAAIEAAPGVRLVALEYPFPAYVIAASGKTLGDAFTRSWGHPWATAVADGAQLTAGLQPKHSYEIAIDESLAQAGTLQVGDQVQVALADGTQQFTVTGIVARIGAQFEHAVFFTQEQAAKLGGTPKLAFVETSNVEALRAAVPGLKVATGAERAGSLQLDLRQAELTGSSGQFLTVIASLALLIAIFVTSTTLSVSIAQRRRESAMLRLVGTKPTLIRRLIVWEAVLLGGLGGVLGALLGIPLAMAARDFFAAQNLMARGTAIAEELVVTDAAVAKHINRIFAKLKIGADLTTHKRVHAVLAYLRR